MKNYESVVIFYPDVEEEERKKVLDRLSAIINSDGELLEIEEWGDRKFAYEINYYSNGIYYLFKFKANNDALTEFDRISKIQDSIIRHMTINLDK